MLNRWLFTQIDNSNLIFFRVLFGALLAMDSFGSLFTGWVHRTFIEPEFTFNFIGLEFLQPLPGNGMLWYYGIMGTLGIFIMLGLKYRWSIALYSLMWAAVYLMQKSSYNNHYYLLMLLNFLMFLLPAHRYFSIDARLHPKIRSIRMPRWCSLVIIAQLLIVYTFAALAKLYPDWWDGTFPRLLMLGKKDFWLVGDLLQQSWAHTGIVYFGFFFDLLIIPLMLWRRTRIFAFGAAVFFHLFNSFILHIGIFPYLALALLIFFFPAKKINRYFLWSKPLYQGKEVLVPSTRNLLLLFFGIWFCIQLALPVRHWFFKDDVLWTEEGHRLAWRMMLRTRHGTSVFEVVDKATGDTTIIDKSKYLTAKQIRSVSSKPDMIWQFAQLLEQRYADEGKEIEVYVDCRVRINGRPFQQFIDPKVDLAAEKWKHFSHHDWILPSALSK